MVGDMVNCSVVVSDDSPVFLIAVQNKLTMAIRRTIAKSNAITDCSRPFPIRLIGFSLKYLMKFSLLL
jgi:hypothetical protein